MKNIKKIVFLLAGIILLSGCSKAGMKENATGESEGDKKLKVYASVYPMYDFTKKIAGDKMDVEMIMPQGTEPHGWEPDSNAIKNLENADMFIYNGAELESWTDKVLGSLSNKELKVVEASESVDLIKSTHTHDHEDEDHDHNHEHEANHNHNHEAAENNHNHEDHDHEGHHHGPMDPHVWISPKNAKIEMENIKNALVELDKDNEDYYESNYEKYAKMLDELDAKYSESLGSLPNKEIVVSHEAYGYLCKDYGLTQIGVKGVNAETEPDAKKMAEIISYIKENNITSIFTEELIDPKVSNIIASETGCQVKVLSPIEGLSQEQVDNKADYFSVMEENLENLVGALK
ncbi:metal ABC transporter substrate-binding protein [uncultured Peptoniphilus sp.]|uniref:metal ABC transporter substrate-binding protein n=1 Tax=uncultured Peptoniphilus sp. TaxID=254354 RepID=UPI0025D0C71B|nr:metal ABC transporter substrate-binding protein [uncultured Peptoniphilus sp.]